MTARIRLRLRYSTRAGASAADRDAVRVTAGFPSTRRRGGSRGVRMGAVQCACTCGGCLRYYTEASLRFARGSAPWRRPSTTTHRADTASSPGRPPAPTPSATAHRVLEAARGRVRRARAGRVARGDRPPRRRRHRHAVPPLPDPAGAPRCRVRRRRRVGTPACRGAAARRRRGGGVHHVVARAVRAGGGVPRSARR